MIDTVILTGNLHDQEDPHAQPRGLFGDEEELRADS